jgi:hypothetical protein
MTPPQAPLLLKPVEIARGGAGHTHRARAHPNQPWWCIEQERRPSSVGQIDHGGTSSRSGSPLRPWLQHALSMGGDKYAGDDDKPIRSYVTVEGVNLGSTHSPVCGVASSAGDGPSGGEHRQGQWHGQHGIGEAEPGGATKMWLHLLCGSRFGLYVWLLGQSCSKSARLAGLQPEPWLEPEPVPCQRGPKLV